MAIEAALEADQTQLENEAKRRQLLAIDNKLRGCDLVRMKIGDLVSGR